MSALTMGPLQAAVLLAVALANVPARAADTVIVATVDQAKLVKIPPERKP